MGVGSLTVEEIRPSSEHRMGSVGISSQREERVNGWKITKKEHQG